MNDMMRGGEMIMIVEYTFVFFSSFITKKLESVSTDVQLELIEEMIEKNIALDFFLVS